MKKQNKERRVVNIDKDVWKVIKAYCESHSLRVTHWLGRVALDAIATKTMKANAVPSSFRNPVVKWTEPNGKQNQSMLVDVTHVIDIYGKTVTVPITDKE